MRVNASVRRSAGIYQLEGGRGGHFVYHAVKRWNGPVKKVKKKKKMSILSSWCWPLGSAMLDITKWGFKTGSVQSCSLKIMMESMPWPLERVYTLEVYTLYTQQTFGTVLAAVWPFQRPGRPQQYARLEIEHRMSVYSAKWNIVIRRGLIFTTMNADSIAFHVEFFASINFI